MPEPGNRTPFVGLDALANSLMKLTAGSSNRSENRQFVPMCSIIPAHWAARGGRRGVAPRPGGPGVTINEAQGNSPIIQGNTFVDGNVGVPLGGGFSPSPLPLATEFAHLPLRW